MSWAEIMELREELKDLRRHVGGDSIKLGKDNKPVSRLDDEIEKFDEKLKSVKDDIDTLGKQLKALDEKIGALQKAGFEPSAEVKEQVQTMAVDLKKSTDQLEKVVKKN